MIIKEAYPMELSKNKHTTIVQASDTMDCPVSVKEALVQDTGFVHSIPSLESCPLIEDSANRDIIFGQYLREIRGKKKFTVRQLASKAKISYAELSRIENGKPATPSTLRKLSPYLAIPIDSLLADAGYNFKISSASPVYLDLEGREISLIEKALKIYSRDVELFFQLDTWIEGCNDEEIELTMQFLSILKRKRNLEQGAGDESKGKNLFQKVFNGLHSLIQACSAI